MKPVPIAQYLGQKTRAGTGEFAPQRPEAAPLAPKLAPPANDSRPHGSALFRRLPRAAPPASHLADDAQPQKLGRADGDSLHAQTSLFRPRGASAPPPPDLESRLAEAYQRGLQAGLDTAKVEVASARAQERTELQKHAVVERLDFEVNEYARLADLVSNGLVEIERRIADVVARLLQPFVAQAVSNQVVEELAINIARLHSAGHPGLMKIRGPERLLSALKMRVADLAIEVEYLATEGVEITVEAQPTSIKTEFARWSELLASLSAPA